MTCPAERYRLIDVPCRDHDAGFTLIDMIIALSVIGILVAVALPSYRSFVSKSNYGKEKSDLSSLQVNLENFYNANNRYPSASSVTLPLNSAVTYTYTPAPAGGPFLNYVALGTGIAGSGANKVFAAVNSQQVRCGCIGCGANNTVNPFAASLAATDVSCPILTGSEAW